MSSNSEHEWQTAYTNLAEAVNIFVIFAVLFAGSMVGAIVALTYYSVTHGHNIEQLQQQIEQVPQIQQIPQVPADPEVVFIA